MKSSLQRLQEWFSVQCDGDWEHGEGILIRTLDNPGWMVDITLVDTALEGKPFLSQKIDRGEHDWIHVSVDGTSFRIRCGSANLDEAITLFCDWAAV